MLGIGFRYLGKAANTEQFGEVDNALKAIDANHSTIVIDEYTIRLLMLPGLSFQKMRMWIKYRSDCLGKVCMHVLQYRKTNA